jgi:hypothetical protein
MGEDFDAAGRLSRAVLGEIGIPFGSALSSEADIGSERYYVA